MSANLFMNRRVFVAGLGAGVLAACAGGDPPPMEAFYRLGTPAPVQPLANGPISGIVDVPPVRTMGVVGDRAILYRNGSGPLAAYAYHTWQEPPGVMIQRALIDALRAAQVFETVATPAMRLDRTHELLGDLRRLEHVVSGGGASVLLELEVSLRQVRGNAQVLAKTYRVEQAAAGTSVVAATAAFTQAMDSVTASLLADLASLPKAA